jgi:eukaryotic-like serine/threonine-protein kinase
VKADRVVLNHALDSVADGSADIDWTALEGQLEEPSAKQLIRQLRILADVSDVHRSTPAPADEQQLRAQARALARAVPANSIDSGGPVAASTRSVDQWGHLSMRELLGKGSFGEVYLAIDTQLDREVALKLLYPRKPFGESVDRLLKEARTLARVSHPNIVGIYGAEVRDGRVGLWMEYVKGKTLATLLLEQGPFGEREAANIGQDLCHALAAVHGAGIVHRDVKAQNVMRAEGGRVVLMDFGAGQLAQDHADQPARLTGTPLYLAPELLAGADASVQSDIYSLGVLLYHLVTGRYPVTALSLPELMDAHRTGRRVGLHDARPDLRDSFVATVERALDPDPAKRFSSAGAMLAALRSEHVADLAPWPGVANTPHAALRWIRAHRLSTYVVVAILGAVLFAASYFRARPTAGLTPPVGSVAVLFERPASRESGVLAAGFAEGLTSALGKIEALRVAEWSTASRFLDRAPAEVAAALRVDAVVTLSVEPGAPSGNDGDRSMRIRAQVLRAGVDLLAVETITSIVARFPREQAAMALAIAKGMGVALSDGDQERLKQGMRHVNPDAYVEFVKGLQRSHRRDQASLKEAVAHYERAIRLDPDLATPYAALSEAYSLLRGNFGAYPAQLATDAALGSAMKAIELDQTLVYGWVSLGFARFYLEWNMPAAEQAFLKALELNPADAMAHHHYGNYLSCVGRHEEGIQQRLLARERDPNSLIFTRGVAWNYFFARRYLDAARELEGIVAVDPDSATMTSLLARTYVALGRFDEGISMLQKNVESQGYTDNVEKLAYALAAAGRRTEARALLAKISGASMTTYVKPYDLALVQVVLGERETALDLLERAYDVRDGTLLLMKVDPRLDDIRTEPRFGRLLARLGL